MNDRPIKENSANDFTVRMNIRRTDLNKEIATLRGQINLLQTQGIITYDTEELLWNQLREIMAHKTKIESDYYDMRNTLERYEKNQEVALSTLREIGKDDSTAGYKARNAINEITGE